MRIASHDNATIAVKGSASKVATDRRQSPWTRIILTAGGILLVTSGHYLTPQSLFLWHNIFQRLYYVPIVLAAIWFGWAGGLLAAACSALCYIPHILMVWRDNPTYTANQYAEIVVFFLVGAITGVLSDRERKRSEQLQQTADRLDKVYRELQDSFEQLKRADRLSAIGQLAASLAHEIRNPLASIEGAADVLERGPGSEERRVEFLAIIKKECQRLNRLLTGLLDFARPRQPRFRPVIVEQVIRSVVGLAAHAADKSGITLLTEVSPDLPPVEGDPEQLQQVVLNLTLNAIQAMPDGGRLTVSARRENAACTIRVTDEGSGISEADLEKIFDPFYTTKQGGTGLGLSVAHQIIAQHGGAIKVARNPDRGMTFAVVLPIRHGRRDS